jgi:hypothetical protein
MFNRCDLLLSEDDSRGWGQFGIPEAGGTSTVESRYQATASEDVTVGIIMSV